jgi:zinc/manganese transport system substrate-binding protein
MGPSMRRRALLTLAAFIPVRGWAAEVATVASFSVLADLVRRVGGGLVHVTSLVPPDTDGHTYQPTAADSRVLTAAQLLVENGLGFEGWMTRLSTASGFHGARVTATTGVTPRFMREGAVDAVDPHAWQDPRAGVIYVRNIADGLATADPAHAETYRSNAAAFITEIERTDAWIASRFAPIPPEARRIITTHDAFGYYGDRYGIKFLAAEGLSTEAEPSGKAIRALVAQVRREKLRAVFLENMTNPGLARMLARETGATLAGPLYSDALSGPGGPAPSYLAMLRYNTALFERAMRPA